MDSWKPLSQLAEDVKAKHVTATELVDIALERLEKGKDFKAIITTMPKRARQRAENIDAQVKNGENPGRLAGIPFIAKDNFLVFGAEMTAASNMLKGFDPPYQATAIERLEAEGAICVAKANLDAFAHGSSTENSDFFTTLNPYDKTRVPGGSSGGSATAVALGMAPFALGTDTGGSIRQPASFTGVVGLKPTYGLVSRSGVVAMASSADVIGPFAKSVEDAALVLDVMAGHDELDATTIARDKGSYCDLPEFQPSTTKIGIIKEYFEEGLSENVRTAIEAVIDKLKSAGYTLEEVSLPSSKLALACYYILCPAELSSNLSRYDGQHYPFSDPGAKNLNESYIKSRSQGFGDEAKRRIMIGTYVLSSGYYDAYYQKAQLVRTKLINESREAFAKYDFLIGPTTPTVAFKIGAHTTDPLEMYMSDVLTVASNLTGSPAISIPGGEANNLPIGIQLIAESGKDRELLAFSKQLEELLV